VVVVLGVGLVVGMGLGWITVSPRARLMLVFVFGCVVRLGIDHAVTDMSPMNRLWFYSQ